MTSRALTKFLWRFRIKETSAVTHPHVLGPLETNIMGILWEHGESNVRDVIHRMEKRLAYTTVMTTLDRLFKKGLLQRRKLHRAFLYSPRFSQKNWQARVAGDLVADLLAESESSREILLSCLVDAVGEHDETLLDELENKIQMRRQELLQRGAR